MSTKPIREALDWVNTDMPAARDDVRAALAAVRAIEEMARSLVANGDAETTWHEGRKEESRLLESIAKEAP